ncbi:cytochrome c oxidase subunit II [Oleiharenicola lentus]|uniref:cytochrome c oxidase subunit II n=1 Tax=Oleiharenicola lentus TaxID=2508720 RepID=UPI003F671B78
MTRPRIDLRKASRFATTLFAGLGLAFLTGCSKVFSLSGHQSTMVTEGPVAKAQWDLFMVTVWVTGGIFIVVGAVLAYAQIKFRAKPSDAGKAEVPHQGHGNPLIEIGLIAASIVLLAFIAIPTLKDIWYTHDVPEAEKGNALEITATGYQWWFKFEYPTEMAPIPSGGEAPLTTGNELVVPVGVPVRVALRTVDVIHSFWIPKLAGKVDMIPNRANHLWFKADKAGYFYGQCAEYCGESHAIMRFRVIALDKPDYDVWLAAQKQPARNVTAQAVASANAPRVQFASYVPVKGEALAATEAFDANPFGAWQARQAPQPANENATLIAEGHRLFKEKTCTNCHTTRGHDGGGVNGPDLTHVGARSTIAAGVLENTPERLHAWIKDPQYFKPGSKMYYGLGGMTGYVKPDGKGGWERSIVLSDTEIDALVAYLQSLK